MTQQQQQPSTKSQRLPHLQFGEDFHQHTCIHEDDLEDNPTAITPLIIPPIPLTLPSTTVISTNPPEEKKTVDTIKELEQELSFLDDQIATVNNEIKANKQRSQTLNDEVSHLRMELHVLKESLSAADKEIHERAEISEKLCETQSDINKFKTQIIKFVEQWKLKPGHHKGCNPPEMYALLLSIFPEGDDKCLEWLKEWELNRQRDFPTGGLSSPTTEQSSGFVHSQSSGWYTRELPGELPSSYIPATARPPHLVCRVPQEITHSASGSHGRETLRLSPHHPSLGVLESDLNESDLLKIEKCRRTYAQRDYPILH